MAKQILPGVPHFDKQYSSPKPGVPDTQHIIGFGEHSKFFTPKNPVKVKSGATGLNLGRSKVSTSSGGLGRSFPPKLKGIT